jgi:hypothetical protein
MGVAVGRVCLDFEEPIFGRYSRCEGLLLLALLDSENMGCNAAEGLGI